MPDPARPDLSPVALRVRAASIREWAARLCATRDSSYYDIADLLEALASRDEARDEHAGPAMERLRATLANLDTKLPLNGSPPDDQSAFWCSGVRVTFGDLRAIAGHASPPPRADVTTVEANAVAMGKKPCTHPARNGIHEWYLGAPSGRSYCRACGAYGEGPTPPAPAGREHAGGGPMAGDSWPALGATVWIVEGASAEGGIPSNHDGEKGTVSHREDELAYVSTPSLGWWFPLQWLRREEARAQPAPLPAFGEWLQQPPTPDGPVGPQFEGDTATDRCPECSCSCGTHARNCSRDAKPPPPSAAPVGERTVPLRDLLYERERSRPQQASSAADPIITRHRLESLIDVLDEWLDNRDGGPAKGGGS